MFKKYILSKNQLFQVDAAMAKHAQQRDPLFSEVYFSSARIIEAMHCKKNVQLLISAFDSLRFSMGRATVRIPD